MGIAINAPLTVILVTVISYYSFQNEPLTIGFFKEEDSCLKMLERKCGPLHMLLNISLCWPGKKLQPGVLEVIPSPRVTQTASQTSIFLPAGSVFPVLNPSYWKTEEKRNNGKKISISHSSFILSPLKYDLTWAKCHYTLV